MYLLLISSYLWDWNSYVGCVLPFNNIASALLLERDYFKDPPDGCHLMWVLSLTIIYIQERVYIIKSSCIFHILLSSHSLTSASLALLINHDQCRYSNACQNTSNIPIDCPSSRWYQPPLPLHVVVDGETDCMLVSLLVCC